MCARVCVCVCVCVCVRVKGGAVMDTPPAADNTVDELLLSLLTGFHRDIRNSLHVTSRSPCSLSLFISVFISIDSDSNGCVNEGYSDMQNLFYFLLLSPSFPCKFQQHHMVTCPNIGSANQAWNREVGGGIDGGARVGGRGVMFEFSTKR